jgi:hypothetical protein
MCDAETPGALLLKLGATSCQDLPVLFNVIPDLTTNAIG